jgi:diguanylate cyclase (GGDEF)-like protein
MTAVTTDHIRAPIDLPPEIDELMPHAHVFLNAVFGDENGQADVNRLLDIQNGAVHRLAWSFVHAAEENEDAEERHVHNYECLIKLCQYFAGLAGKDGLTGLFNKLSLQDYLADRLDRMKQRAAETYARRGDVPGKNVTDIVLYVDLDKFKPINDTYGHAVGDDVLKLVSHALSQEVRQNDMVARIGGDEFVLLLGDVTAEEAREAKERIDSVINNLSLPIEHEGTAVNVQIGGSVGMAYLDKNKTAQDVETEADFDMYETKKAKGAERRATYG